ncbi:hypothetical protein B9Z55_015738 [Caenorhabditis nigoni]|uniref:Uncharacterized protein n=1 Tax=Caenorhabditis nigoni TaxID=1611254 RepID=A0A2G5UBI2_9PELO|nr:hypothetical protein B9Z55_015738 [Caenorhabditis nigoni]
MSETKKAKADLNLTILLSRLVQTRNGLRQNPLFVNCLEYAEQRVQEALNSEDLPVKINGLNLNLHILEWKMRKLEDYRRYLDDNRGYGRMENFEIEMKKSSIRSVQNQQKALRDSEVQSQKAEIEIKKNQKQLKRIYDTIQELFDNHRAEEGFDAKVKALDREVMVLRTANDELSNQVCKPDGKLWYSLEKEMDSLKEELEKLEIKDQRFRRELEETPRQIQELRSHVFTPKYIRIPRSSEFLDTHDLIQEIFPIPNPRFRHFQDFRP